MFRSAYLSGLLMSHGTDSVRTRRACGKRNNEALRETGMRKKKEANIKKRTSLSEPVLMRKMSKRFFHAHCRLLSHSYT